MAPENVYYIFNRPTNNYGFMFRYKNWKGLFVSRNMIIFYAEDE